jgi:hypothetical protein
MTKIVAWVLVSAGVGMGCGGAIEPQPNESKEQVTTPAPPVAKIVEPPNVPMPAEAAAPDDPTCAAMKSLKPWGELAVSTGGVWTTADAIVDVTARRGPDGISLEVSNVPAHCEWQRSRIFPSSEHHAVFGFSAPRDAGPGTYSVGWYTGGSYVTCEGGWGTGSGGAVASSSDTDLGGEVVVSDITATEVRGSISYHYGDKVLLQANFIAPFCNLAPAPPQEGPTRCCNVPKAF